MAKKEPVGQKKPEPRKKRFWWLFAAILLFSLITKCVRLQIPSDFYFDEVYHGFTATQYTHGSRDAYDPWAQPPPGKAFEWTHPPLAKLIMAGFLLVTGEKSIGWRIGSVLFGTGVIAMTMLLALELFATEGIALLAGLFVSLEGLCFVQARLAMNDSYFLCFALAALLFYVRWKKFRSPKSLYWSGALLGCAAASKWTTLYVFGILIVDLGREYLKPNHRFPRNSLIHLSCALIALPAVVYLASFTQFFWVGWDWDRLIELHRQMWWYHSNLKATHAYQSVPWQWILNLKPVWMYAAYPREGVVQNIYNVGNSIILIGGLLAVIYSVTREKTKDDGRWLVLLCYFMLWVPWSFSPRIMLFYHYLPAVPFLCIILARELVKRGRRWIIPVVAASVAWFALFYPNMTALPVSSSFANHVYFLIPSWK